MDAINRMDVPVNSHSLVFVEDQYAAYLRDPSSVSPRWRRYFDQMTQGNGHARQIGPSKRPRSYFNTPRRSRTPAAPIAPMPTPMPISEKTGQPVTSGGDGSASLELLQERVDQLIRNYRVRGHMIAQIDPLEMPRRPWPELDPINVDLTESDMDRPFSTGSIPGPSTQTLRQILQRLRNTYCRSIGVQFMHINDQEVRGWLQRKMESTENRLTIQRDEQMRILRRLTDAVVFEQFLAKKYIGAKTFSLEGAETLIPLLDLAIETAGAQGVDEIVIGMAHRGRLNVLANILGKEPSAIFREFEDVDPEFYIGGGDVKYHLGHSSNWKTVTGHSVHLSLCFNPSHLEYINTVAMGRVRAMQDRSGDTTRQRAATVLIHGDAAMAGEGIVQETLNLSQLEAYRVGGTIHIVVNNQLGFTTAPEEARSSIYCTDVAKMLEIPIFHVNGEDPEAVAQVVKLAMDFRREFQRDVVIDMYCYRKRGHNEGDEPAFTQPQLYEAIEKRSSVREAYLEKLLEMGDISREEADAMTEWRSAEFEQALDKAKSMEHPPRPVGPAGYWEDYLGGKEEDVEDTPTGIHKDTLIELFDYITSFPEDFHPHRKIQRGIENRQKMAAGEKPLDWAAAEMIAMASLAYEGHRIRMTGQDVERGTFSQRHAVLHDVENGDERHILRHVGEDQAPVEIANSPLSEAGVLGFEYGYSLELPEGLTAWEAQFGDFCNAAQVIIDQFIASAEDKWRQLSGITLLLPHGFEGQGPEHSSARLERWLMLCAEQNMQITYPTTPAQYFHLLRRQVVRPWRKPLVVMTPKSLLRHPQCVSPLEDLTTGVFKRVIEDDEVEPGKVERIVLCTGKIYYDLIERRDELDRDDVAIIRMEQLYPFPARHLMATLEPFSDNTPVVWAQEEPKNMGAWQFIRARFGHKFLDRFPLSVVSRSKSASPATGSHQAHKLEQDQLMTDVFGASPTKAGD